MSSYLYKLSTQIADIISLGVTGYVDANFTKSLYRNGAAAAETLTVSEVGTSGNYAVTFTPTAGVGDYNWVVRLTAQTSPRWIASFAVRDSEVLIDSASVDLIWDEPQSGHETAATVGYNLASAKYHVANKATISTTAYTVYKDDGTTVHKTGTTTASDGTRTPA